jgi:hypothetical protein
MRSRKEQMDSDQKQSHSRRTLVKIGVVAVAGATLAFLAGNRAAAAEKKLAKSDVQYKDAGKSPGKDCDDCVHFIPGKSATAAGTCALVEGDINPHGHCAAFTMKPRK